MILGTSRSQDRRIIDLGGGEGYVLGVSIIDRLIVTDIGIVAARGTGRRPDGGGERYLLLLCTKSNLKP